MDSETSNERYFYEALSHEANSHPIRLVRILPGESDSQISCELSRTQLVNLEQGSIPGSRLDQELSLDSQNLEQIEVRQNPKYTALSYVWGGQADSVTIQINGKKLSVTRNLFKFLHCHRDSFLTNRSTEGLFWIDAICIDQSNIDERSKQVQFMAEVYKNAQNVLVWLGAPTESAAHALEHMFKRRLSPQEERARDTVFSGGWWERLWVIQEAAHAKSLLVRCGSFEFSWEDIKSLEPEPVSYSTMSFFLLLQKWSLKNAMDELEAFGVRKCYDPRDVVFALRSILPALMPIVPDYSACTADVFTSAARAAIFEAKNLTMLEKTNRIGSSRWTLLESKPLASWVPDWTLRVNGHLQVGNGRPLREDQEIDHVLSLEDANILLLRGATVDRIHGASEPFEKTFLKEERIAQVQSWFPDCEKDFIKNNVWPQLKLGTIVNDWLYRKDKNVKITEPVLSDKWLLVYGLDGCSFITTKSDRYGFMLGEAKEGDLVFVAYGSRCPFVLRLANTIEESCTLVGCAIIDDLKMEEAFEMINRGELQEQEILLR